MTKPSGCCTDSQPASHVIATEDMGELLAAMLAAGKPVRLPVHGSSMLPSIRTGDVVEITPAGLEDLRTGDVVACRVPRAELLVHRLIAKGRVRGEWWLILWPETVLRLNPPIPASQLLGKGVAVERAGREVDFSRRLPLVVRYRARVALLQLSRPYLWHVMRAVLWPARRAFGSVQRTLHKLAARSGIGWLLHRRSAQWRQDVQIERVPPGPPPRDRDWQWLALYRGRMIGTVSLSSAFGDQLEVSSCWLAGLWVDPWYRRQGLGRLLVEQLIDLVHAQEIPEVLAAVRRDNAASLRLLGNCGFVPVDDAARQEKIDRWYERIVSWPPGTMLILRLQVSN